SSQKQSTSWQRVRYEYRSTIFNVACLPHPYGRMLRSPFLIGKMRTSPSATAVMKNRDAAVSLRLDDRVIAGVSGASRMWSITKHRAVGAGDGEADRCMTDTG